MAKKSKLKFGRKLNKAQALLGAGLLAIVGVVIVIAAHAGSAVAVVDQVNWHLNNPRPNEFGTTQLASGIWTTCLTAKLADPTQKTGKFHINVVVGEINKTVWDDDITVTGSQAKQQCSDSSFKLADAQGRIDIAAYAPKPTKIDVPSVSFQKTAVTPTNLQASDITKTTVKLTWDNPAVPCKGGCGFAPIGTAYASGGTGYNGFSNSFKVRRFDPAHSLGVDVATVTATSFTDTKLTPNTPYGYTVRAVDPWGSETDPSTTVLATTVAEGHQAPRDLHTTDVTAKKVELAWKAPATEMPTSYKLYRRIAINCNGVCIADVSKSVVLTTTTDLKYTDTDVKAGQDYGYFVFAVYSDGQMARSNVIKVTPAASGPVTGPAKLHEIDFTANSITIGWTDNDSRADHFVVYRNGKPVGRTRGQTYTDDGLQHSSVYGYQVVAVTDDGRDSVKSNTLSAHTTFTEKRSFIDRFKSFFHIGN